MFTKPFSEKTAELIDAEVRRLVDEAVELTRSIISEERENIERLADLLIEKETIFSEDVEAILGKSEQQKAKELLEAELKQTEVESAEEVEENESDVEVEVVVGDGDETTTIKYVFDTESSETKEEYE
jgi:cell division protease FtsH